MIVVLLGPPGSGKGTQAKRLWTEKRMAQLSTGDMLRTAIQNGSALGKEAKSFMDQGMLVPDDLVVRLIDERIKDDDCKSGCVLDGFPRNRSQAEALDRMLAGQRRQVDRVIFFEISESELVRRLSGRRTCLKCGAMYHVENARPRLDGVCDQCGSALVQRGDDTPQVIEKRQSVYQEQTKPLIDFYQQQGKLATIDAKQVTAVVGQNVLAALGSGK